MEKLKKYDVEICHCALGEHMETIESSNGNFFKVEEVEPILIKIQSEICDLIKWYDTPPDYSANGFNRAVNRVQLLEKLQQLSDLCPTT